MEQEPLFDFHPQGFPLHGPLPQGAHSERELVPCDFTNCQEMAKF